MKTPEKGPLLRAPSLQCTFTVETLASKGNVKKTVTHKKVKLILGRNEFRDMIVRMDGPKHSLEYQLRDFSLHKRFMKEGKATITLKDLNLNLMIANAPPNQLLMFMKTLASKQAVSDPRVGIVSVRQRLLSALPKSFEEISPLTFKEYETVRKNNGRMPLKERNGNVPDASPVSSKRKKENKGSPSSRAKVPRFLSPLVLTSEQQHVLQLVQAGQNVFFTGSAGTGKSFLLKRIVGALPPDATFVTASTGVAACHIGGTTLHSFAGIGSGQASFEQCFQLASRKMITQQWKKCRHLIVDEISMVDGDFFKKLEAVGRAIRGNDKPFGGIQLILCGDFLQLPPVTKPGEKRLFCFQTSAWDRSINLNVELTDVRRQDDQEFINILQSVRLGRCTDDMVTRLKSTENNIVERDGIKATRLCTHREDVNHINQEHLNKLTGNMQVFQSIDSDTNQSSLLDSQTPVVSRLVLKVGAQVMLMKNLDISRGLVNGARGVVTGFKLGTEGYPIVRFICGVIIEVKHEKWTVRASGGNYLTRRQLPLKLAWAFSIHKSQKQTQTGALSIFTYSPWSPCLFSFLEGDIITLISSNGMTLDCAEMSLSRVFEAGQAYVALSRARNLKGLRVLDFNPACVRAHPDVLRFYQDLRRSHSSE